MRRATYTGPLPDLSGKTALVKADVGTPAGYVEVQFDDVDLEDPRRPNAPLDPGPRGRALGFGWHRFPASDFDAG
jgi:hypothetical protein